MEIPVPQQPPSMPYTPMPMVYVSQPVVWQYRQLVVEEGDPPTTEVLNQYGAEGWELAGILCLTPRVVFYFKRLAA
jgi:hypothetical protein